VCQDIFEKLAKPQQHSYKNLLEICASISSKGVPELAVSVFSWKKWETKGARQM
jgi:hypothetical protein